MSDITKKISEELHVSSSTISRALNNCPGVNAYTKERITALALRYGYNRRRSASVGVVLPCVPSYFWRAMAGRLIGELKAGGFSCQPFYYSKLSNNADALNCVRQAFEARISVLIVAAQNTREVCGLLGKYSGRMLIIVLNGQLDAPNTFFVGEDRYLSGYALGKKYAEVFSGDVTVNIVESFFFAKRIEGFVDALRESGGRKIQYFRAPDNNNIMPSVIARELAPLVRSDCCVYCPDGIIPQVCLAIVKLKSRYKVRCVGFEDTSQNKIYAEKGILKLSSCQNIAEQCRRTVALIDDYLRSGMYPDRKYIYIDNEIVVY